MPLQPNAPLLNTIPTACARSGLPRTTLYGLIGAGALKAVKSGRRTLITEDSLRSYISGLPAAKIASPRARAA